MLVKVLVLLGLSLVLGLVAGWLELDRREAMLLVLVPLALAVAWFVRAVHARR